MAHIPGKYELTENKNYYDLLIKVGAPVEHAKAADEAKSTLDITVNGNKIHFISDALLQKSETDFIVNEEIEESFPNNITAKSTTTLNGNVITINSVTSDNIFKRVYTFSAAGVEVLITINKEGVKAEATRIYKRV